MFLVLAAVWLYVLRERIRPLQKQSVMPYKSRESFPHLPGISHLFLAHDRRGLFFCNFAHFVCFIVLQLIFSVRHLFFPGAGWSTPFCVPMPIFSRR